MEFFLIHAGEIIGTRIEAVRNEKNMEFGKGKISR